MYAEHTKARAAHESVTISGVLGGGGWGDTGQRAGTVGGGINGGGMSGGGKQGGVKGGNGGGQLGGGLGE